MSLVYNKSLIENAKSLRKNATPWEKKLWFYFLSKYPVRFQRQKVIGNYIADFYCYKAQLVIELDGSGHYDENKFEYDAKRTKKFEEYGIKVLRFTNIDIDNNFYEICSVIDKEVKERLI
ncbi:MAG: endonuclease domain-containing protein [Oscillospiraceae bacterium]